MTQYAYFDTNTGSILNWIDTVAFTYQSMPPDLNLLAVNAAQWADRAKYFYVVKGALSATPAPLTAAQIAAAANTLIKEQIKAIEDVQARAVREAALGVTGAVARLQALDAQIVTLRGQLK